MEHSPPRGGTYEKINPIDYSYRVMFWLHTSIAGSYTARILQLVAENIQDVHIPAYIGDDGKYHYDVDIDDL